MQPNELPAYGFIFIGAVIACFNGFIGFSSWLSIFRTPSKSGTFGMSTAPLVGMVFILIGIGLLGWHSAPVWLLWVSGFFLLIDAGGPVGFALWLVLSSFFHKLKSLRSSRG